MKKNWLFLISVIVLLLNGYEKITPLDTNQILKDKDNFEEIGYISSDIESKVKKIYEKCSGCHGKNGEKSALGKSDPIGGKEKEILATLLVGYKYGGLNQYGLGEVMEAQVFNLRDDDIELFAEYIFKLSGD